MCLSQVLQKVQERAFKDAVKALPYEITGGGKVVYKELKLLGFELKSSLILCVTFIPIKWPFCQEATSTHLNLEPRFSTIRRCCSSPPQPRSWFSKSLLAIGTWGDYGNFRIVISWSVFPLYSKPKVNNSNPYEEQTSDDYCVTTGSENRKKKTTKQK